MSVIEGFWVVGCSFSNSSNCCSSGVQRDSSGWEMEALKLAVQCLHYRTWRDGAGQLSCLLHSLCKYQCNWSDLGKQGYQCLWGLVSKGESCRKWDQIEPETRSVEYCSAQKGLCTLSEVIAILWAEQGHALMLNLKVALALRIYLREQDLKHGGVGMGGPLRKLSE